jgi:hypothetical protein
MHAQRQWFLIILAEPKRRQRARTPCNMLLGDLPDQW